MEAVGDIPRPYCSQIQLLREMTNLPVIRLASVITTIGESNGKYLDSLSQEVIHRKAATAVFVVEQITEGPGSVIPVEKPSSERLKKRRRRRRAG